MPILIAGITFRGQGNFSGKEINGFTKCKGIFRINPPESLYPDGKGFSQSFDLEIRQGEFSPKKP
ncbi:MAG: hypothetical protein WCP32_14285 [Bacteroidota bacterium]